MTIRTPIAHSWTLDEMKAHLIYVREGRKVLGRQLLSLADFKGITENSRMLVDDDKEAAVSKLWLMETYRITADTAKDAYELRKSMPPCPPFIEFREDDADGL